MSKLDEARTIIQQIDIQMIELFLKRMKASKMVAEYKKENQLPILDKTREDALIKKNMSFVPLELQSYYKMFFDGVLVASKAYQEDLNR